MDKNRGFKAGGIKTVINGSKFEQKTSIEQTLINMKFTEKCIHKGLKKYKQSNIYMHGELNGNKILYFTQKSFSLYFKKKFDIDIYKNPDEAFVTIIGNIYNIKILEKKNQNVSGSVEDKLKTGILKLI